MSNVKVDVNKLANPTGKKLGYASLTFDDKFVVKNISIYEGENGLYVRYPSVSYEKNGKTEYKNICNPITKEAASTFSKMILDGYNSAAESQDLHNSHDCTFTSDAKFTPTVSPSRLSGVIADGKLYINDNFVINNITVREASNGHKFVAMPSYPTNEVDEAGKKIYKTFCNPITSEFAKELNDTFISKSQDIEKEHPAQDHSKLFKNDTNIDTEMDFTYDEELPFN